MATLDRGVQKENEKTAFIFGAEGDGLAQETLDAVDSAVKIPIAGGVDSLYEAASAAVVFCAAR